LKRQKVEKLNCIHKAGNTVKQIGQMYALFAAAIRTGQSRLPTFDTAVDLHRFLETIKQASDAGRELPVA
jgi:predicted dehydrogenase